MHDLVPCNRFACRLTLQACVKRYRLAEDGVPGRGYVSAARVSASGCRGCPQGKERSKECRDA